MALITLTTDFGIRSAYVPVMKGVILSIAPQVQILDLTHQIAPQNIREVDRFLGSVLPLFPLNTIHVAVVDPGVGSDRSPLCIDFADFIAIGPDNGLFTQLLIKYPNAIIRKLNQPQFWRSNISNTFHGRDIFAPVAAHLANGVKIDQIGEIIPDCLKLAYSQPTITNNFMTGEIDEIDDFGNIITNLPPLPTPFTHHPNIRVEIGDQIISCMPVLTYSKGKENEFLILASSDNRLEIAIHLQNAANKLNVKVGNTVTIYFFD